MEEKEVRMDNEEILEREIDVISILKDVLRGKLIIILLSLAVGMLTFSFLSWKYEPQYTSEAVFSVSSQSEGSSVYLSWRNASDAASSLTQVMNNNVLRRKIAEDLGIAGFVGTATASNVEATNLVILRVTTSDPRLCFREITSILENHHIVSDKVLGNVVLESIKNPTVPTQPDNPPAFLKQSVLAGVVTFVILLILTILLVLAKNTVRTEYDVEKKLDVQRLATIGHESYELKRRTIRKMALPEGGTRAEVRNVRKQMKRSMKADMRNRKNRAKMARKEERKGGKASMSVLVTDPMVSFRYVESMQKLARRVQSKMDYQKAKTLLVTSVMANEGKSTVAANLALTLAKANNRVLLLDADLRNPSQYRILRLSEKDFVDLGSTIQEKGPIDKLVSVEEETGLRCIMNRHTYMNSSELLTSELFKGMLKECEEVMDYIIIDSPPMAFVADVEDLISLVDTSLLVVRQNISDARDINDAVDALRGGSANLIGCVFNDVERANGMAAAHGYNYTYGYGGSYGAE